MNRAILVLLFFSMTILGAKPLAAQETDANQALLKRAAAQKYEGASLLVLYDSTDVDMQDSGLSHVVMHKLVKALTPDGALQLRNAVYDYDPMSADVEVLAVRVYRSSGRVDEIPLDRVHDYPAPARAIYWGARQKLVDIGRVEMGDAVETRVFRKGFTYALLQDQDDESRFVPPMKGEFYDIVEFWSSVPVQEKVYRVFVPENKPLQFEVYNGDLRSAVHFHPSSGHRVNVQVNPAGAQRPTDADALHPTSGLRTLPGKITYTFVKNDIAPLKTEPDMVSPSDVATKLLLSTSRDWYAKSLWFNKVNEDFGSFEVTPEVKSITDGLLKGVTDELQKISILNHWVAEEIRYSGISMGKGEGYTLHPGAMTFLDRCGVCKDKAGMLVTMLRAAGFESYPAMTMAGSRIDRIPADQFNHSVTVVKRASGDWMLLDPTWIPGVREMWSSAEQQQEYLLGIPGGADVMTTPVSPAENHYWKASAKSALDADGTLEGTLELEAEGQSDALLRRAFTRTYKSGWVSYIPSLFADISPLAEVTDIKVTDIDDVSRPMRISLAFSIPHYAVVLDGQIRIVPLLARNPFSDYFNSPELRVHTELEERAYGFRIRCSKLLEVEETMKLPRYEAVVSVPKGEPVHQDGVVDFKADCTVEGGTLRFSESHRMEKRVYEASDWPAFRAALLERQRLAAEPVILSK